MGRFVPIRSGHNYVKALLSGKLIKVMEKGKPKKNSPL
jgi:hypothetical protein